MENENKPIHDKKFEDAMKPMSAFRYFLRSILYMIPVIGWLALGFSALNDTNNVNVREHARSFIWGYLLIMSILFLAYAPKVLNVIQQFSQIVTIYQ